MRPTQLNRRRESTMIQPLKEHISPSSLASSAACIQPFPPNRTPHFSYLALSCLQISTTGYVEDATRSVTTRAPCAHSYGLWFQCPSLWRSFKFWRVSKSALPVFCWRHGWRLTPFLPPFPLAPRRRPTHPSKPSKPRAARGARGVSRKYIKATTTR